MVKRKIIWSHGARIKLYEILEYYAQRNKSKTYSAKLYWKFNSELKLLIKQPNLGIKTEVEQVRGLIVDKYIIYYEVLEDNIVVHALWDSRQNPNDLKIK